MIITKSHVNYLLIINYNYNDNYKKSHKLWYCGNRGVMFIKFVDIG